MSYSVAMLLAGAVIFGVLAWIIKDEPLNKVFMVIAVICALLFLIFVVLGAFGQMPPWHAALALPTAVG